MTVRRALSEGRSPGLPHQVHTIRNVTFFYDAGRGAARPIACKASSAYD